MTTFIRPAIRWKLELVSSALASSGFLTRTGKPYTAEAVSRMVKG